MTRCICSTAYGYTSAVRKTTRTVENGCQTKFSEAILQRFPVLLFR